MIDNEYVPCVCANIGPRMLTGYERQRGSVVGVDPPAPWPQSTLYPILHDIEHLLDVVTNDGCQHLDDDLIVSCYYAPPKMIPLMRRIAFSTKYVWVVAYSETMEDEDRYSDDEETEEDVDSKDQEEDSNSD